MTESPCAFRYPADLFDMSGQNGTATLDGFGQGEAQNSPCFWSCVRTRPRWEKKLTRWLIEQRIPCFLPVHMRTTVSHRKKRTHAMALFPGYVFVARNVTKFDLSKSGCVVRVLKPGSEADAAVLHRQLRSIWIAVASGQQIVPLTELRPGQRLIITEGVMRGVEGTCIRNGRHGRLVLEVDLLGCALTVEMPPDCRFQIVG